MDGMYNETRMNSAITAGDTNKPIKNSASTRSHTKPRVFFSQNSLSLSEPVCSVCCVLCVLGSHHFLSLHFENFESL